MNRLEEMTPTIHTTIEVTEIYETKEMRINTMSITYPMKRTRLNWIEVRMPKIPSKNAKFTKCLGVKERKINTQNQIQKKWKVLGVYSTECIECV